MVVKIADNILSPLGLTTLDNYRAVKEGRSELRLHPAADGVLEPYYASILDAQFTIDNSHFTKFERMCIGSVSAALSSCTVDVASPRVLFVVSTTKGNVHLLAGNSYDERTLLGNSAAEIARYFGNPNMPVVVSNACISGLCAQILAHRLIGMGLYDYVVAVGADVQSPFIINGFQSLKALSAEPCRPFDADRKGLNLGEAAATVVYGRAENPVTGQWAMLGGAVRNDANHISGPSRTGEGSYLALRQVLDTVDRGEVAFVNCHGTATLYNDEMESIAITRAGLSSTPINSLKGYYGHTMGAAGLLETLLSMCAVEDGTVLATKNFSKLGVGNPVNVSNANGTTDKKVFIKLISGFGGCNAAAAFRLV